VHAVVVQQLRVSDDDGLLLVELDHDLRRHCDWPLRIPVRLLRFAEICGNLPAVG
jgi:hypothetical protein